MPYKNCEIRVKSRGEKGTIFEDNYKRDLNDKTKNKYGNSYVNGHLKSNISFTPDVIYLIFQIFRTKNIHKHPIKKCMKIVQEKQVQLILH